jgi:hypothetical protein
MVFLALCKIVGLSVVLSCVTGHDTQYQDDHVRDTAHAVLSSSRELSPNQNVSEDRWFFSFFDRVFWCLLLWQCNPPAPSKTCGIKGSSRAMGQVNVGSNGTDKIVGGTEADTAEYPWMVYLKLGKTFLINILV